MTHKKSKSTLPPLRVPLTNTNIEILRAVLRHRLLSVEQIQKLCLPCKGGNSQRGRLEYTRQLLRVLCHHKYLVRRRLIGRDPGQNSLVFASTWKSAQAVAAHDECDPKDVGWDVHDGDRIQRVQCQVLPPGGDDSHSQTQRLDRAGHVCDRPSELHRPTHQVCREMANSKIIDWF